MVAELDSRLPGRGAHCCFRPECLREALRPRTIEHALRRSVFSPEPGELLDRLHSLILGRVRGLLGTARRKGVLSAGREAAFRASRAGLGGRIFVAQDLAERSRRAADEQASVAVLLPLTMEELGEQLGRAPVGVLFVADERLAESIVLRASQAFCLRTA